MSEEKDRPSWADRNEVLKVIKSTESKGWLHLLVAKRKSDGQTFLRLKKYYNWFSIPSAKDLKIIQEMLVKGSNEVGWDSNIDIKPVEVTDLTQHRLDSNDVPSVDALDAIPEEVIELIHNNPKATTKLISSLDMDKLGRDDLNYLRQVIEVLNDSVLKANNRLKASFQDLLQKITKEDIEGMDKLSDLMNTWSLVQITSLTKLIKERLDTIEVFENLIHDDKTYELKSNNSIHRILEKNMWLIDENYWLVQSNKSIRSFVGDELERNDKKYTYKRLDFFCVQLDKKLIIVEIKRPSIELGKDELDQIELYLRMIKKYKGKQYNSIDAYLIGNKISDETREILEFRRGIKVKTYQDMLETNRYKYQDFLDAIGKE